MWQSVQWNTCKHEVICVHVMYSSYRNINVNHVIVILLNWYYTATKIIRSALLTWKQSCILYCQIKKQGNGNSINLVHNSKN